MNKFWFKQNLLDLYIALFAWKTYRAEHARISALKIPNAKKEKLISRARNARNAICRRFKVNAANRKWQAENPDKMLASRQKYYAENPGLVSARTAEWRKNNPERFREIQRRANHKLWSEDPKRAKEYKRSYRRRQTEKRIEQGQHHINNNSMAITAAELRRQFERGS